MYLIVNLAIEGRRPSVADDSIQYPAVLEINHIRACSKTQSAKETSHSPQSDYQVIFWDKFSVQSLDYSKWKADFPLAPFLLISDDQQICIDEGESCAKNPGSQLQVYDGRVKIVIESVAANDFQVQLSPDDSERLNFPTHKLKQTSQLTVGSDTRQQFAPHTRPPKFVNGDV